MTSPRSSSDGERPGSQVQGALLIGVAVVIGLVLLLGGLDTSQETSVANGSTTTTSAPEDETSTTTTTAAPRTPAQVVVLVANGSGKSGVAGQRSQQVATAGYQTLEPTNAPDTSTSSVWYASGYETEANAVAQVLGIAPSAVGPLPAAPPVAPGTANILVVIGTDIA